MIELYCIADGQALPCSAAEGSGLERLRLISWGGLACVAADVPTSDRDADPVLLVERDRVIRRFMVRSTVIPFRFATLVPGEREVRAFLESRADELRGLLSSLRGRVELALRAQVTVEGRPVGCDGSGASYLRMRGHRAVAAGLDRLHAVLGGAAVAAVLSPDGPSGIKSAYLVDSGEVASFCDLLADTTSALPDVRNVSLTGPWPPYSFVEGAAFTRSPLPGQEAVANVR